MITESFTLSGLLIYQACTQVLPVDEDEPSFSGPCRRPGFRVELAPVVARVPALHVGSKCKLGRQYKGVRRDALQRGPARQLAAACQPRLCQLHHSSPTPLSFDRQGGVHGNSEEPHRTHSAAFSSGQLECSGVYSVTPSARTPYLVSSPNFALGVTAAACPRRARPRRRASVTRSAPRANRAAMNCTRPRLVR